MKDYGEGVDPTTNGETYVRHTPRDGKAMDLYDVAFDSSVSSRLKFAVSLLFFVKVKTNLKCRSNLG